MKLNNLNLQCQILSNFSKGITHLVEKRIKKKQGLSTFKVWVLWMCKKIKNLQRFKDVNFVINGKYFKNIYDNPNYNVSLWFFKHTKM